LNYEAKNGIAKLEKNMQVHAFRNEEYCLI
jgi:hypothetical protein